MHRLINMSMNNPTTLRAFILVCVFALSACSGSRTYVRTKNSTKKTRPAIVKVDKKEKESESYDNRVSLVGFASKFLKTPYNYGGKSPSGFDCSGFTSFVFSNYGYTLKGSSRDQSRQGDNVGIRGIEIGDLMFFGSNNKVTHVAMVYEVDDSGVKIIHATSSKGVTITHYTDSDYWIERFLFAKDVISDQHKDFAFN